MSTYLPLATGLATLLGAMVALLRFRRDDTTAVVTQHAMVMNDQRLLNEEYRKLSDELQEALDRCRLERERLVEAVRGKNNEVKVLEAQLRKLRRQAGDA